MVGLAIRYGLNSSGVTHVSVPNLHLSDVDLEAGKCCKCLISNL
jgi:hypothetical protein